MRIPGHPRIDVDSEICFGRPRLAGTRLRVSDVLGQLAAGATYEQLLEDYPPITMADIKACLAYAVDTLDHRVVLAAAE
jgi:uncharacterized protein (DUF433 family)